MLFEDEFRRPENAGELLAAIRGLEIPPIRLMEVCGTHTMSIARSGLRQVLPKEVKLISGPGCPVCVTPASAIDQILELASQPDVILTTYGDLMRVPGSTRGETLRRQKASGAQVEMVYSPMDALDIAAANPDRQVVFLGVGFETTAPGTAVAVLEAKRRGLRNFSLLCLLKRTIPALHALIAQKDLAINGFLCPGHVAIVLGAEAFRFLPETYGLSAVIGGFETGDLLAAIYLLLRQQAEGRPRLENEYTRTVSPEGNTAAQAILEQVFTPCTAVWRGLGEIPESGLCLRKEFSDYDATNRFPLPPKAERPTPCRCGDVICGRIEPTECPLFGTVCTPEDPTGPCMVSGEGACAAAYHYGRHL